MIPPVDLLFAIAGMAILPVIAWMQHKSEIAAIDEEAKIQRKFIESLSRIRMK